MALFFLAIPRYLKPVKSLNATRTLYTYHIAISSFVKLLDA